MWIVANINRAVDDKAAKSLLGDSFKLQLKYDGTFSRVTFICTKTDDISNTEISDNPSLRGPKIDEFTTRISVLQESIEEWERYKYQTVFLLNVTFYPDCPSPGKLEVLFKRRRGC